MPQTQPTSTAETSVGNAVHGDAKSQANRVHRVAVAGFIGNFIEFYDFLIYGVAAALVFGHVFFPALGAAAGTAASFATLGVAFVARPAGGIIFGHFGDRLGRKNTLVATLILMGAATVLVGCMPTTGQIGVAAPVLLVCLRILQGLAAGGEWAGSAMMVAEYAPKSRRGFWGTLPNLGGSLAVALAPLIFLVTNATMSDEAFMSWGWRIPFLSSIVLIAVGLYVRMKLEETPVFEKAVDKGIVSRTHIPFLAAIKRQPRQVLVGTGVSIIPSATLYFSASFLPSYGRTTVGLPNSQVLMAGFVGGLALLAGVLVGGTYSDRIGRRRVMIGASASAVIWTLAIFPILSNGSLTAFIIGNTVLTFISGLAYGPLAALMSELFHTEYRYTAVGLCYNVAGVIGAAIPPILGAMITARFGAIAFGIFMSALCFISLMSALMMRDNSASDLTRV